MHASLSSIVSTCNHFWHDGHTIYTRNSLTLGVQSNVNEDDTSQWKLWIGIYLKCIHEQGGYFLHNSKNIRNRCINLLLYQLSIATFPSGAVEFTPISCVELVFLNPKFSVQYLVYIIVCLLASALSVVWLAYALHGIDENLKTHWKVEVGWHCNKTCINGRQ